MSLKHQQLINYLECAVSLPEVTKEIIRECFLVRRFKKGQYILNDGELCRYNNFVINGAFRMFIVDENFKEHNLQFAFENWWIGDAKSFFKNVPTRLNIQCFENAEVLSITQANQEKMLESCPELNSLFREKFRNSMIRSYDRILSLIGSDAQTRYKDFLETYPQYLHRLPNQYIASYIGVTPEFFSKLKKEYWQKAKAS